MLTNQLAILLSFPRFGYTNQKIPLSAQTGCFYHLPQKSRVKIVRNVSKPATIPCCLLLSQISSSDWLQSCSQPPPSLYPLLNIAALRLVFSSFLPHFMAFTFVALLFLGILLVCTIFTSPPCPSKSCSTFPPPPGHSIKYPLNQRGFLL